MLPNISERIPRHTPERFNRAIEHGSNRSVRHHASRPEWVDRRLAKLDRECNIQRTLEANAATLAFAGVALAATVDRRCLAQPAAMTAFLPLRAA